MGRDRTGDSRRVGNNEKSILHWGQLVLNKAKFYFSMMRAFLHAFLTFQRTIGPERLYCAPAAFTTTSHPHLRKLSLISDRQKRSSSAAPEAVIQRCTP